LFPFPLVKQGETYFPLPLVKQRETYFPLPLVGEGRVRESNHAIKQLPPFTAPTGALEISGLAGVLEDELFICPPKKPQTANSFFPCLNFAKLPLISRGDEKGVDSLKKPRV
jgi:hypothetical protein